jgi:hypothetical protein
VAAAAAQVLAGQFEQTLPPELEVNLPAAQLVQKERLVVGAYRPAGQLAQAVNVWLFCGRYCPTEQEGQELPLLYFPALHRAKHEDALLPEVCPAGQLVQLVNT